MKTMKIWHCEACEEVAKAGKDSRVGDCMPCPHCENGGAMVYEVLTEPNALPAEVRAVLETGTKWINAQGAIATDSAKRKHHKVLTTLQDARSTA